MLLELEIIAIILQVFNFFSYGYALHQNCFEHYQYQKC
jgi:hypothetical protein